MSVVVTPRRRGDGTEPTQLVIESWSTSCGDCGYGAGGWAASPALKGLPVLHPDSRECPGCGVRFTHSLNVYTSERIDFEEVPA